jgi:DNA-binding transcriptional LysR family regulator
MGSFSIAAKSLSVTQQALSLSIDKLEKELGVTFFLRSKTGVEPTEIAVTFKADVDFLLDYLDKLQSKIQMIGREINGHVNLGLTPGAVPYFVPRLLSEFSVRYPHVDLSLNEMSDLACVKAIQDGTVDFACMMRPSNTRTVDWTPLLEDDVLVMMRKDNPLSCRSALHFSDLIEENFILPPKDFRWNQRIKDLCKKAGYRPKISYVTGDLSMIYSLVRESGSIAFMSRNFASAFRVEENAQILLAPEEGLEFKIGIAKKKGLEYGDTVAVLMAYIRDISKNIALNVKDVSSLAES